MLHLTILQCLSSSFSIVRGWRTVFKFYVSTKFLVYLGECKTLSARIVLVLRLDDSLDVSVAALNLPTVELVGLINHTGSIKFI